MGEHLVEHIMIVAVIAIVIVGAVSWFAGRIGVATPLLLTVIGIGLGFVPGATDIVVDPEVILTVVLPPLLYAAALHVPIVDFRRNLQVIAFLAIVLVIVSALAVGGVVALLWPSVGFALALALGAVVAPPDAVAATSLGKRLGLPPRIVTILEGEGLINDATALVLLSTAIGIATGGDEVTAGSVIGTFLGSVLGALVIGWIVGAIAVAVRSRFDDVVFDAGMSIVVPFVAFLIAEQIGASGIVAVVVAGIMVGNAGRSTIGARKRQNERITWGTFTMLVENAVFLYMGLRLRPTIEDVIASEQSTWAVIGMGLLVTLLLVLLRFAAMPLLLLVMRGKVKQLERRSAISSERMRIADDRFRDVDDERITTRLEQFRLRLERNDNDVTAEHDQRLGWRDGTVIGWAGMRGVVTVAAVQTLPSDHPWYSSLVLVAFVVAIVTLVVQGLSLPALVRGLRLQSDQSEKERVEYLEVMQLVRKRSDAAVEQAIASSEEPILDDVLEELRAAHEARTHRAQRVVGIHDEENRETVMQYVRLRRTELAAARKALRKERAIGAFSSEVLARVQQQLDIDELQLEAIELDDD